MSIRQVELRPHILIINPNSSSSMTEGVANAAKQLALTSIDIYTYTAPEESPDSINDGKDLEKSCDVVMRNLSSNPDIKEYSGFIVACYSVHPLVKALTDRFSGEILVTGIFEASILAAISLLSPYPGNNSTSQAWGIVTTGKYWERNLSEGVAAYLGQDVASSNIKFAGVFSTGLNAGDFHGGVDPHVVTEKLKDAARRLLTSASVGCVVMGCAGMIGLEDLVREVAVEVYGPIRGNNVYIVDGVEAAIGQMDQMIRNKALFQGQASKKNKSHSH